MGPARPSGTAATSTWATGVTAAPVTPSSAARRTCTARPVACPRRDRCSAQSGSTSHRSAARARFAGIAPAAAAGRCLAPVGYDTVRGITGHHATSARRRRVQRQNLPSCTAWPRPARRLTCGAYSAGKLCGDGEQRAGRALRYMPSRSSAQAPGRLHRCYQPSSLLRPETLFCRCERVVLAHGDTPSHSLMNIGGALLVAVGDIESSEFATLISEFRAPDRFSWW